MFWTYHKIKKATEKLRMNNAKQIVTNVRKVGRVKKKRNREE